MSAITAMVRTNMAAMAHVFLAHRVRSIHIEKDTNLLENICDKQTSVCHYHQHQVLCTQQVTNIHVKANKMSIHSHTHPLNALYNSKLTSVANLRPYMINSASHNHSQRYIFCSLTLGKMAAREHTVRISNNTSPIARVT